MAQETTALATDDMNALAVGIVLDEISQREGTSAAAKAATDPVELEAAAERVTVALIIDASRGLRKAKHDFEAMLHETIEATCANALENIQRVREITCLAGRARPPWAADAVLKI